MKLKKPKDILPASPKIEKKKKEKKPPTEFWQQFVEAWFTFYKKKFNENPVFDGSAPRNLKAIVLALQKRATEKNVVWTKEEGLRRFNRFLSTAEKHWLIKDNFMLFIIDRHKEKVFQMLTELKNAKQQKQSSGAVFSREGVNAEFNRRNYN